MPTKLVRRLFGYSITTIILMIALMPRSRSQSINSGLGIEVGGDIINYIGRFRFRPAFYIIILLLLVAISLLRQRFE